MSQAGGDRDRVPDHRLPADGRRFAANAAIGGVLLLLAVLVGLAFLNSPGTSDRARWILYMGVAHEHGLMQTYPIAAVTGIGGFPTDYPPLALMILGVIAYAGSWLGQTDFVALKLSLLLVTLACAGAMVFWQGRWQPLQGAAMFGALFLDSMLLVYLDVYFIFVLLCALYCLKREFLGAGAALFAVAVFIKWQPIVLGPFILLYMIRPPFKFTYASAARMFVPGLAVVAATYFLFGNAVIIAFFKGIHDPTFSGSALNLNWLATAAIEMSTGELQKTNGVVHTLLMGGYPLIESLSNLLRMATFAVTIGHFYYSERRFTDLLEASIVGFLCYFVFGSGVHENHALVTAVLALCWVATTQSRHVLAVVLVVMVNVNLMLFFGMTGTRPEFSRVVLGCDVSIYLSLFYVAIFAVLWGPMAWKTAPHLARLASAGRRLGPIRGLGRRQSPPQSEGQRRANGRT